VLEHKLTKEEAGSLHATGTVYFIACYDQTGKKILRIAKIVRGAVFFEFVYAYYPNGRLQSAKVTNSAGQETFMADDERGPEAGAIVRASRFQSALGDIAGNRPKPAFSLLCAVSLPLYIYTVRFKRI
jgi:hypothetical protein